MPSFNETFKKVHLATKATTANTNQVLGFIVTAGKGTDVLSLNTGTASTTYGVGSWGLFNAKTFKSVTTASIGSTAPNVILVSSALQLEDKIGQFHGGYMESNKSKDINPKYITQFQKFVPCASRQHTIHIGSTKYTKTLSPTQSSCSFEFKCGEDYNLRLEIRNDPAYRFMTRNIYRTFQLKGGCCADGAPGAVIDGTLAMIEWANQMVADPEIQDFIQVIVYSEAGVAHYAPGTTGGVYTWDNYVSPGHVDNTYAGIRIQGAYVDTTFGTCSFDPRDYYNKIPIEIMATMIDFEGNPCEFTGICVNTECLAQPGSGFGNTFLRDIILHERYRQNNFASDNRMREIELGDDILDAISRGTLYYAYAITHSVPRYNNPNNTFSNEQYTNIIITNGTVAQFETLMAALLTNAKNEVTLETFTCGSGDCTPLTP
jgi:hypothetical protein